MGINLELKEGPHSHSSYYPDFANYSFNFLPKASPGFSGSLIKWRPSWPEYSSKQIANVKTPFNVFEDIDVTMISGSAAKPKVIIHKLRGEISLVEQDTIEYVS